MMQVIVKGKLDYADGEYLITNERTLRTTILGPYIDPYIGKRIVISLEEEEPILNENLNALFVHEI